MFFQLNISENPNIMGLKDNECDYYNILLNFLRRQIHQKIKIDRIQISTPTFHLLEPQNELLNLIIQINVFVHTYFILIVLTIVS